MWETEIILITGLFLIVMLLFLISIFIFYRQVTKKKTEYNQKMLVQKHEYEQELLKAQFEIQQQTMQEIGREIHDNVGQKLTLASLYIQQLNFDGRHEQIQKRTDDISIIIDESLQELRDLSKSLTSSQIQNTNLKDFLEKEVEKICTAGGFSCRTNINIEKGYSTLLKTIVFRIVQEFIQNSFKHSKGNQISLTLEHNLEGIHLILKDNGIGFDYKDGETYSGIGLENIRKRTLLIGGQLKIQSSPYNGVLLNLLIPKQKIYE